MAHAFNNQQGNYLPQDPRLPVQQDQFQAPQPSHNTQHSQPINHTHQTTGPWQGQDQGHPSHLAQQLATMRISAPSGQFSQPAQPAATFQGHPSETPISKHINPKVEKLLALAKLYDLASTFWTSGELHLVVSDPSTCQLLESACARLRLAPGSYPEDWEHDVEALVQLAKDKDTLLGLPGRIRRFWTAFEMQRSHSWDLLITSAREGTMGPELTFLDDFSDELEEKCKFLLFDLLELVGHCPGYAGWEELDILVGEPLGFDLITTREEARHSFLAQSDRLHGRVNRLDAKVTAVEALGSMLDSGAIVEDDQTWVEAWDTWLVMLEHLEDEVCTGNDSDLDSHDDSCYRSALVQRWWKPVVAPGSLDEDVDHARRAERDDFSHEP